jgi:hypothetical protein
MKKCKGMCLCVLMTLAQGAMAQTVTVDGEFRPRIEARDGFGQPLLKSQDPLAVGLQRTRLGLNFKTGTLATKLTIQDARTYGETSTNSEASTTAASTSIFEAWAEMILIPGGSVKVGRQTLKYDDGRLFNNPAWSNTGTSHDMVLMKYGINDFQAHVGFAYNNTAESKVYNETFYTPVNKYRYMGFLWMQKPLAKNLNLSLIGVDEGVQDTTGITTANYKKVNMYHYYTYGGNLKYGTDATPFSLLFTFYNQSGKTSTGKTVDAYLAAFKANVNFCPKMAMNAGVDIYSGDDNTKDSKQKYYKKLYGTNHSLNGYMEYWTTAPTQGLADYYLTFSGKPTSTLGWEIGGHLFNALKEVKSSTDNLGKSLGGELDLTLKYKINEWAAFQGGYSCYFVSKPTKYLKFKDADADTSFPQWAYVMLSVTPSYLKNIFASK